MEDLQESSDAAMAFALKKGMIQDLVKNPRGPKEKLRTCYLSVLAAIRMRFQEALTLEMD